MKVRTCTDSTKGIIYSIFPMTTVAHFLSPILLLIILITVVIFIPYSNHRQ